MAESYDVHPGRVASLEAFDGEAAAWRRLFEAAQPVAPPVALETVEEAFARVAEEPDGADDRRRALDAVLARDDGRLVEQEWQRVRREEED